MKKCSLALTIAVTLTLREVQKCNSTNKIFDATWWAEIEKQKQKGTNRHKKQRDGSKTVLAQVVGPL